MQVNSGSTPPSPVHSTHPVRGTAVFLFFARLSIACFIQPNVMDPCGSTCTPTSLFVPLGCNHRARACQTGPSRAILGLVWV